MSTDHRGSTLPSLGPRGEGWVVGQMALASAVLVTAAAGPRWDCATRGPRLVAATALAVGSAALAVPALKAFGSRLTPFPRPRRGSPMQQDGAYAYVRHPMYGSLILGSSAVALAGSPLAMLPAASLAGVLEGKRRVEEQWLVQHFEGYAEYRAQVPKRFVPGVW